MIGTGGRHHFGMRERLASESADIVIGNWFGSTGSPVILQQQSDGRFSLKNDPFLERLLLAPMVNPQSDGNEGNNLLLDLHLTDIN
jgi:hypothetical protein